MLLGFLPSLIYALAYQKKKKYQDDDAKVGLAYQKTNVKVCLSTNFSFLSSVKHLVANKLYKLQNQNTTFLPYRRPEYFISVERCHLDLAVKVLYK